MTYDQNYYNSLNYVDYMNRHKRYYMFAKEILNLFNSLSISTETVLDYGCAVGFLVDSLNKMKINASGYDISEWAVDFGRSKGFNVSNEKPKSSYDVGFFLDVLEHIPKNHLQNIFGDINFSTVVFRIPVSDRNNGKYILDVSERDPTHIIRWTKETWEKYFLSHGFIKILRLNLYTIYDTEGVYCGLAIK